VRTVADSWAKEMFERERTARADVVKAAEALIADVRRRYPGEELRCPYMRALDDALRAGREQTGIPPADLNRRALVEQRLLDAYHGKRPIPTREECLELAKTLGVPDEYREELPHQWLLRGIERLMRDDPAATSPRGRLLSEVVDAVEKYEKAIYG